MKNFRKFTSAALAIVMALLSANVYAVEATKMDEAPLNATSNILLSDDFDVSDLQLSFNNSKTIFELDTFGSDPIEAVADNSAENDADILASALSETENTPPVAELSYMVANQDTLIDGNFTTDTIIYWLWSNGTTDYTYDPDGDEITGRFLGGINEYVLGNVTIGDKIVGFATKFDIAAQHELIYYVQDENGAYSNIVRYSFAVEPADGNKRPICLVSVDKANPIVGQSVKFNWSRSYDPDGESLSSVRVRVYDSEGNVEIVGTSSKYYVGMSGSYIQLKFDQVGKYTVRIEVSDTNNNWSNWHSSSITVKEASLLKNVTLTSDDYNIDKGFKWGDYAQSIVYANEGIYSPEEVFAMTTVDRKPACFGNDKVLGVNWTVSGYVVTESDLPVANEKVTITVPMPGQPFEKEVFTDAEGYFSYTSNKISWYKIWLNKDVTIGGRGSGLKSDWCIYGNKNTTTWIYDTYLTVYCEHSKQEGQSFGVLATTDSELQVVLGNKWAKEGQEWGPYNG